MTNEEIGDTFRQFQITDKENGNSIYFLRLKLIEEMGDKAPSLEQIGRAVRERITRDNEIYLKQKKSK